MDLFKDLLPSILQNNNDVLEDEKEYNAYIVNRGLSVYMDCILYANNMNMNYNLPYRLQYDYLRHSVRKMKRHFKPWNKPRKDDTINTIKEFYNFSTKKAEDIVDLVSEEDLKEMRRRLDVGGTKK